MKVVRSLWASVQGDPVFMRRVNGWLTIFWVAMITIAYEAGWLTSVTFVSALFIWALVSGHWSAWQAAPLTRLRIVWESAPVSLPVGRGVFGRRAGALGASDRRPDFAGEGFSAAPALNETFSTLGG